MSEKYDKIIIGAGFYGLYSALFCGEKGQRVLVLECDPAPFGRATYINQARVHQGYHYPRSLSTAMKSAGYFERFHKDFSFCINREFRKVYATSSVYSWTNGAQFKKFCEAAHIPCEELHAELFFKKGMCDRAFLTREYTYDATILKNYYLERLREFPNVTILCGAKLTGIEKTTDSLVLFTNFGYSFAKTMTVVMILAALFMAVYSLVVYLIGSPIEGWTTTVMFLSFSFFGLFGILTIVIKYLQIIVNLVFQRKRYTFNSIEKLTK